MYARLSSSNFNYSSNPLPKYRNYTKLDEIKIDNNRMQLDNKKFVIPREVYAQTIKRHPEIEYETQFFDKIKVPEQAHVVQQPIAKDGR
uniref:Uncharacterized protein n=1 Tax=viral metagenome TaxID=1070528 RepID=A0A6C0KS95_9ZZZZ